MKNSESPLLAGCYYHIFNHANGHENLFANRENYFFFLKRYGFFINPIAESYAYCLMPNHFHVLVRIKEEVVLLESYLENLQNREKPKLPKEFSQSVQADFVSRQFASLFSSYTQAYNKQQTRKGSLFIPNFKRKAVETEDYFIQLVHYIHANPVHHGFVKEIENWEHSSYHAFSSQKPTLLQRDQVLDWFGGVDEFRKYHKDHSNGYRPSLDFE
jgi:putative transposase